MKVAELIGARLDYWVGRADGVIPCATVSEAHPALDSENGRRMFVNALGVLTLVAKDCVQPWRPSTDWLQGGPLMERVHIQPWHRDEDGSDNVWHAVCPMPRGYEATEDGPTLLVAAMRAYVASKFGDEVPCENI
ncbi:phage protein NinX family protein [Burkholderia cenocepacia]|uniref:phage protein NinX family protein n=1 Tax=Burkholderia cenocepacia TaxID=95486 RepID=UPI002AB75E97|nr:phage protein NinX family protein [Burkholderia cenocepacia]